MIQSPMPETLVEHVRRALVTGAPPERDCDLVNSVVDSIVQANISLHTVTLEDMKDLLDYAIESRHRMLALLPWERPAPCCEGSPRMPAQHPRRNAADDPVVKLCLLR